jgi:hypothetical protein
MQSPMMLCAEAWRGVLVHPGRYQKHDHRPPERLNYSTRADILWSVVEIYSLQQMQHRYDEAT